MSSPQPSTMFQSSAFNGRRRLSKPAPPPPLASESRRKLQVCVAAENRLLRDALTRLLTKPGDIEVFAHQSSSGDAFAAGQPDVFLLASRGNLTEDLALIQRVRSSSPDIRILLIGMARNDGEFLQCVRAGISGYLLRDATSEEVLAGVRAVHAGEAICPGALCILFFRYFAQEGLPLHAGNLGKGLKLSGREQQLLPMIARGLTNKQIATDLGVSEQTVKNHLQRLKKKLGVQDRLDLAHLYHTQGLSMDGSSPPGVRQKRE